MRKTGRISFTSVVDDFGAMCENTEDAKHLEAVTSEHHPVKSDWKGEKHIGIDLKGDYENRELTTSNFALQSRSIELL